MTPAWVHALTALRHEDVGPRCEVSSGWLVEPVAAVTSLAFVVAGAVVAGRRHPGRDRTALTYAALVAGIGVGSVVQHGPDPVWSDPAHDLPLVGTLAFVAADGVADLTGRRRRWWWWTVPTAVMTVWSAHDLPQALLAVVAVAVTVLRARRHRPRVLTAVALLGVGGVVGRLSRGGGPLCDPGSVLQGHALWHVLAATALVVLAPVVGTRDGALVSARSGAPGRAAR